MQPRRPAAQNFNQPAAETGAAAGCGDHQRAIQVEPCRFVRDARDSARREDDALPWDVMNEGDHTERCSPRLFAGARGKLTPGAQACPRSSTLQKSSADAND